MKTTRRQLLLLPQTMLLAALLAMLLLSAAGAGTYTPRIPSDTTHWATTTNLSNINKRPAVRFWTRDMLLQGNIVDSLEQARPLLQKLASGQPITVLALGTSITASYGGCFQRDEAHRAGPVQVLPDSLHSSFLVHCDAVQMPWLAVFMEQINKTWPHPDHLLINLGISASSFQTYADSGCLEDYLPRQADLVVLEHLPNLEQQPKQTTVEAERLLHRLQLFFQGPMPAVVVLSMQLAVASSIQLQVEACIKKPQECVPVCADHFQKQVKPTKTTSEFEVLTHAFASHYKMTSISQFELLDTFIRKAGMDACDTFGALYADAVHPDLQGRMLLTDLLIDYLARAEVALAAAPSDPAQAPYSGVTIPSQPLDPASVLVYQSRCFRSQQHIVSTPGTPETGSSTAGLQSLTVHKAEGWNFVEIDGASNKHKPGWVATEPGSVLWIDLPLLMPLGLKQQQQRSQSRARRLLEAQSVQAGIGDTLRVHFTYLVSYMHMGKAELTCLEACSCGNAVVDGFNGLIHHSHGKMQYLHTHIVKPGRCILQVKVLPETASKENKVKVIQVTVGAMLNMTEPLKALASRQRAG